MKSLYVVFVYVYGKMTEYKFFDDEVSLEDCISDLMCIKGIDLVIYKNSDRLEE